MSKLIVDALKAKYVAERLESLANLQTYLSTAVGVGDHSNIVAECDKLIDCISKAEGKLQTVTTLLDQSSPEE
jgi:hypothetical protein